MRIGILGAGQLARMLIQSGKNLGLQFHVYAPESGPTVAGLASVTHGGFDDTELLTQFFEDNDRVTYEWENLAIDTLKQISNLEPKLFPSVKVLELIANRYQQKRFFNALEIPTAACGLVSHEASLESVVTSIQLPGILKTNRMGYDGKGQRRVRTIEECKKAWKDLGGVELEFEKLVPFKRELSLIACRSRMGEEVFYPLAENIHRQGVLIESIAPADVSVEIQVLAESYAKKIFHALNYVGVLVLELFDTSEGLLINEMASRVHNSGHWTIEGARTSQFENHLRAGLGLALGSSEPRGYSAMVNIIGSWAGVEKVREVLPDIHIHDYLKSVQPKRKLGHLTVQAQNFGKLKDKLELLRSLLSLNRPEETV